MRNGPDMDTNSLAIPTDHCKRSCHSCDAACCDPHSCSHRYVLLGLLSFIQVVAYFSMESPGGLEEVIIRVMNVDTTQYELQFSASSWSNVVVCLLGGVLVDRVLGLRLGFFLSMMIAASGQLVWALGAFVGEYWVMLCGRLLLGAGSEMFFIIGNALLAVWFKDKEISFAMSIDISACRIGGALALLVNSEIYKLLQFIPGGTNRLGSTLLVGFVAYLMAIACSIIIIIIDYCGEKKTNREKFTFKKIRCSDIKDFNLSFWLIVGASSLYYLVIFSFIGIGQLYFVLKFGLGITAANVANSVVFSGVAVVTPLIGLLVDATGFHVSWGILGTLVGMVSHLLFAFSSPNAIVIPYLSGVISSLSYSFFASGIWPLPALMIREHQVATAYGLLKCPYHISMSIMTIVTGIIVDRAGYFFLEVFFFLVLYLTLALLVYLLLLDITSDTPTVNISNKRRRRGSKKSRKELNFIHDQADLFNYQK